MRGKPGIKAFVATALIGAVVMAAAPPAESHHSFAMYDQSVTKTLTGRLFRFVPGGNHAQLHFELLDEEGNVVTGEDGESVKWGVETGPAAQIARQGVTVDAFPEGTVLTVSLNPLRDGRQFGSLSGVIIKCGTEMPEGGCTSETGEVFLEGNDYGPAGDD